MILSAIWCWWAQVNYSKTTKLQVSAMCSLWKYMLLHQIAREIQFFLTYNVHEKNHKKSGQMKFWQHAFKLFELCICVTTLHSSYNFALKLQLCIHVTWKHTSFQPIRNASLKKLFLLAKKLWYCVGGVFFQRHCDAVSVAGIARILGFINWLDNLNWPLQRVSMFWS